MASSVHGSLTAGVVKAVTVETSAKGFEVVNRDMVGEIWVRTDGVDPVARGDGCYVVLGTRRFAGRNTYGPVQVRLLAEVDRQFSVEGG